MIEGSGPPSPPKRSASRMTTPALESPDSPSGRERSSMWDEPAGGRGGEEEQGFQGTKKHGQADSTHPAKAAGQMRDESDAAAEAERAKEGTSASRGSHHREDDEDAWGEVVKRWEKVKHEAEEDLNSSITGPMSPSKKPGSAKQQIIPSSPGQQQGGAEKEEVYVWSTSPPKAKEGLNRGSIEFSSSPLSTPSGRSRSDARGEMVGGIVSDLMNGRARQAPSSSGRMSRGGAVAGRSLPEAVAARMMEMRSPNWSGRAESYHTAKDEEGELSSVSAAHTDTTTASEAKMHALSHKRPHTRLGFRSNDASFIPASPLAVYSGSWPRGAASAEEELWTTKILDVTGEHQQPSASQANGSTSIFSPLQQTCRYCAYRGSKERVLALGTHHSTHCVRFMQPDNNSNNNNNSLNSISSNVVATPSNIGRIGGDISGRMLVMPGSSSKKSVSQGPGGLTVGVSGSGSGVAGLEGWGRMSDAARADMLASGTATLRATAYNTFPAVEFARALGTAATSGRGRVHLMMELAPSDRACLLRAMPSGLAEKVVLAMPHEGRVHALAEMGPDEIWDFSSSLTLEERVRTLKALPADVQSGVFSCLSSEDERVSVLLLFTARDRPTLLAGLSGAQGVEILTALQPRDCVATLRYLAPLEVEGTLVRMPPDYRDKVISSMPPKEAATLFSGMPLEAVSAVVEGVSPKTLVHALRSLGSEELAAVLGDMAPDAAATALAEFAARDRAGVLLAMTPTACAGVLSGMTPKDAASALKGLPLSAVLGALREMSGVEQASILESLPARDRAEALAEMVPSDRGTVLGDMCSERRAEALRGMAREDIAEAICEMGSAIQQEVLQGLASRDRAAVLCALPSSELSSITCALPASSVAQAVIELIGAERDRIACSLGPSERVALLVALPQNFRPSVLAGMVPRPEDLPEQCVAGMSSSWGISSKSASKLPLSSDGRHADTLMKTLLAMDTPMLVQALLGMSLDDRVEALLCMPDQARAAVMDKLGGSSCAECLASFLLEDRAATVTAMSREGAAAAMSEMYPQARALLLAAVPLSDRLAILAAMKAQDSATALAALPMADCVATIKRMDAGLAAEALGEMSGDERSLTLEALPARERAAIVLAMQHDEAVGALSRLPASECAATLRNMSGSEASAILCDLPASLRGPVLLAMPHRARADCLSQLPAKDRADILGTISDANELSATVKAMNGSDIVDCVPLAAAGVRDKLVRVVAPREAAAILEQIDASEAAALLPSLPVEVHLNFIKAGRPSNVLHKMDDEAREALFAGLPDTLRRSAVEAYGDGNNIDTQRQLVEQEAVAQQVVRQRQAIDHQQHQPSSIHAPASPSTHFIPAHSPPTAVQTNRHMAEQAAPHRPVPMHPRQQGPPVHHPQTNSSGPDFPVNFLLRFDEQFDDVMRAEGGGRAFADRVRDAIAPAVNADRRRVEVLDIQRTPPHAPPPGGLHCLMRCIPVIALPGPPSEDPRTALQLALLCVDASRDRAGRVRGMLPSLSHAQVLFGPNQGPNQGHPQGPRPQQRGDPRTGPPQAPQQRGPPHGHSAGGHDLRTGPPQAPGQQVSRSPQYGVGIAFAPNETGDRLVVVGVSPGSAAESSEQVVTGDELFSIDGSDVYGTPIQHLGRMVLGPAGSKVWLGFRNPKTNVVKTAQLVRGPNVRSDPATPRSGPATSPAQPPVQAPPPQKAPTMPSPAQAPAVPVESAQHRSGNRHKPLRASSSSSSSSDSDSHEVDTGGEWNSSALLPSLMSFGGGGGGRGGRGGGGGSEGARGSGLGAGGKPDAGEEKTGDSPGSGPAEGGHDIWDTLKDLDDAIEQRRSDMHSFTENIYKLQEEAKATHANKE